MNALIGDMLGFDEDDLDELSGYGEEIVGDEDDYEDELDMVLAGLGGEVGARRRRRVPRGAIKKYLRRVQNRQLRRYPLGLGATSIGAGATAIISANPQLPFQVNRLVTPSTLVKATEESR